VSSDAGQLGGRGRGEWSKRTPYAETAVRSMAVVVLFKLAKNDNGVLLIEDQDAVE
jgi:hypothetical protein